MFDPEEFLALAEQLIDDNSNECRVRTSIGRSYYATFLFLREWLTKKVGCGFANGPEDHKRVHDSIHDTAGRKTANKLSKLRRYRNHADYNLLSIEDEKADEAINLAKYIIGKYR